MIRLTPRGARLLAGVCVAAALLRLAASAGPVGAEAFSREPCRPGTDYFAEGGAALTFGVPFSEVSWDMPGWSVTNELLCRQVPRSWAIRLRGLILIPCGLLVFGLGWLLHSALCGGLALLGFSFLAPAWFVERRWLCVCLVTLAAYILAWRARAPTLRRTWLAAVGLAANLAVISTLFVFGPALAAWEWFGRRRQEPRGRRAAIAAVLGLAPLVFLGPWLYMNWRVHHSFILFERGRAESNIVCGALGLVESPGLNRFVPAGRGVLTWAAAEVLRHPLRYLAACLLRLCFVLRLQPWLFGAALLATWLCRSKPVHRQLGFFVLYFIGIHCLMTVNPDYFFPIWPVLLALAASLAARALRLPEDSPGEPWAAGLAGILLAAVLCVESYGMALAAAYPARSSRPAALAAALVRHPDDPWLWSQQGARQLAAGQPLAAASAYERALSLDPQRDYEIRRAWALAAGGRLDVPLLAQTRTANFDELRAGIIETFRHLLRREPAPARDSWSQTLGLLATLQRRSPDGLPDAVGAQTLAQVLREVLEPWPAPDRARLIEGLAELQESGRPCLEKAQSARLWLDAAQAAARQGLRREALAALDRALALNSDPASLREAAEVCAALGERQRESRLWAQLAAATPQDARRQAAELLQRARQDARRGEKAQASAELRRALALSRFPDEWSAGARLGLDLGDDEAALPALEALCAARPQDSAAWQQLAGAALRLGRREEALRALERTVALSRAPADLLQAAQSYHRLGEPARELAVLESLAKDRTSGGGFWCDLASAASRSGHRERASAALGKALGLSREPAVLGYAAGIYEELGQADQALALRRKLAEEHAKDAGLWLDLAQCAVRLGRKDLYSEAAQRALSLGLDPAGLARAAVIEDEAGDLSKALAVWNQLLKGNAERPEWLADRAVARAMAGDRAGAMLDLRRALRLDPRNLSAGLSLVSLLEDSGRRKEAGELCRKTLASAAKAAPGQILDLLQAKCRGPKPE